MKEPPQSRKDFFKEAFSFFKKGAANHVERKVLKKMELPLRPPGALDELEFLSTCTRCDACIQACPHHSILKKSMQGVSAGTPYVDPQKQGCHLCEDVPCVAACEPQALRMDLLQKGFRMGRASVNTEACITFRETVCTSCYDACPFPEVAIRIDQERHPEVLDGCVGCGLCTKPCPASPKAIDSHSHGYHRKQELDDFLF